MKKMENGQATMEFILLILLMMIFVTSTVLPFVDIGFNAVKDVDRMANAKLAAQKLVNALDGLQSQNAASIRTVYLLIPGNASVSCGANAVNYSVKLEMPAQACPSQDCTFSVSSQATFACAPSSLDGGVSGRTYEARLTKDASDVIQVTVQ